MVVVDTLFVQCSSLMLIGSTILNSGYDCNSFQSSQGSISFCKTRKDNDYIEYLMYKRFQPESASTDESTDLIAL